MIEAPDPPIDLAPATAGDIAVINLESARQQSWSRFWRAPERPGTAETIVEQEQLTAQFLGDLAAFDRLEILVNQLARTNPEAAQTSLIAAQVACATHRFVEARAWLAQAVARGASSDATVRLSLSIDQATGENLPAVLAARRERAGRPAQWEELVPLGALLTDLGEFDEAKRTCHRALREYRDVSPFALAWVCFELGALWGERVPVPQVDLATRWYRTAIDYLPCYLKARVHLAEIYLHHGQTEDARALLTPVIARGDPEVFWRLADVEEQAGNPVEAESLMRTARSGFEALLARHLLAFADHAAEFYSDGGGNPARAFELARLNRVNRPTLRAFEQAWATALAAGEVHFAAELIADARKCWGSTAAFGFSPMHIAANDGGDDRVFGSPLTAQLREQANART
jgi:tetratricopeptide (TPR) repeat protein